MEKLEALDTAIVDELEQDVDIVAAWDEPNEEFYSSAVVGGNNNVAVAVQYDWPC